MSAIISALSGMSKESLLAIRSACVLSKESLSATKISKQFQMTSIDISLAPLSIKATVLENAISTLRNSVSMISKNIMIGCSDLGALTSTVESSLSQTIENAENILFDINRLTAHKLMLASDISTIEANEIYLDNLISNIDSIVTI